MTALIPLVLVWLAVLVPQAVKAHTQRRQAFLDSFSRQLGALEAAGPGAPPTASRVPRRVTPAQRRRTVLVGLLLSMLVSALPVVVVSGKVALVVHLAVDDCFLAYVALLVRWGASRARASALPPAPAVPLVVAGPVRAALPA
jgi:hypothetical protein